MEQIIKEVVEEAKKKEEKFISKLFISKFIDKKCIWEDKDCYKFLTYKQHKIATIILKKLYEFGRCSQKKLIQEVNKEFEVYIKNILIKYNGMSSLIRSSVDKSILRKKFNEDDYYVGKPTYKNVLEYLISFFVRRKQIWDSTKNKHSSYILQLSKRGKKVVEAIIEKEELEKQQTQQ